MSVTESLLGFILARLDQVGSPLYLHRELERFPSEELKALLSSGILRETSRAERVGDLIVRQTAKGLFGVADEDEFFQPVPLVEDDVRQYEVVVSKVIDRIRRANDLKGVPVENGKRLFLVGERVLPGRQRADVYLSLENHDPGDFMSICKKVHPTNPRPVVMLVPRPIPLSVESVQLLRSWDVFVAPLTAHLDGKRWALPWDQILKRSVEPAAGQESAQKVYCHVIASEGTRSLDKAQYEKLVKTRNQFAMFLDGMTREAICRDDKNKPRTAKLTSRELAILGDYIRAGKAVRPYATTTGGNSSSSEAARRLFESARKKVDVKRGRYEYRAFRLLKNPTDPKLNSFEFLPPDDLKYCVILPA